MTTLNNTQDWSDVEMIEDLDWDEIRSYKALFEALLSPEALLMYAEGPGHDGEWVALLTDGYQLGLVSGTFGCCGHCDDLEAARCYGAQAQQELLHRTLGSTVAFSSLEELGQYVSRGVSWDVPGVKERLLAMSASELPLAALDVLLCLRRDDPEIEWADAVAIAARLH